MRPIGAAVAGTRFIGPVHVEAIRRLGHRVVGILGSTEAKSHRVCFCRLPDGAPLPASTIGQPRNVRRAGELEQGDHIRPCVHRRCRLRPVSPGQWSSRTLSVSQTMAGRKNHIRIDMAGNRRSFSWDSSQAHESIFGTRDQSDAVPKRDPARLEEPGFSDYPAGHAEGFPDSFKMLDRAITAEAANRRDGRIDARPLFATFADGHEQVVLGEAILKSHTERRWVEIS